MPIIVAFVAAAIVARVAWAALSTVLNLPAKPLRARPRRYASSPMKRRLRVGIATSGRFHVLDLARELHALGHEVRLYSYVPRRRAMTFGLPAECCVDLLPLMAPFVAWQMKTKPSGTRPLRDAHLVGAQPSGNRAASTV